MKVTEDNKLQLPGNPAGAFIINYIMNPGSRNGIAFPGTNRTAYLPKSD